jgi:uncharacterized protein (UPF0333 family)
MLIKRCKGQSTLEYVILIGFVVAALIAMGVYMRRGLQGRLRESTDQIGQQYSAEQTESVYTITTGMTQSENMQAGGTTITNITRNVQSKTGYEEIKDLSKE